MGWNAENFFEMNRREKSEKFEKEVSREKQKTKKEKRKNTPGPEFFTFKLVFKSFLSRF